MKQKLHLLPNKKLIDLGCGDGKVLRFFDKEYLCSQLDGCDINPVAIRRGKFLNLYNKQDNISLTVKDLRETHLGSYDYIFLFLVPTQLDAIQSYLQNNIKSDAIIICNTFQFSDRKPYHEIYSDDKKTRISLYRLDTISNFDYTVKYTGSEKNTNTIAMVQQIPQ